MNWLQDIISKFSVQGLAVVGLAYFRDIGKGGVRTVTITNRDGEVTPVALNEDYNGYIRAINNANYRLREAIDCTANLYDVEQDVAIVMWLDRKVNPNGVMVAIQQAVAGNDILNTTFDKQVILNEEGLPENDYIMMKVVVRMVSEYAGSSCPADVCAVYYDPCFEVPNRPEPSPPVDPCGCECTVGGECCDYSVEGITGVEYPKFCLILTEDEYTITGEVSGVIYGLNGNFITPFSRFIPLGQDRTGVIDGSLVISKSELIEFFEELIFNDATNLLTFEPKEYGFCISANALSENQISLTFQLGNENTSPSELHGVEFIFSGEIVSNTNNNGQITWGLRFNNTFAFEVLINDVWTDVTDEVIDGVWESLNDCRIITDWRIIDAEQNVVATGEVTATNCGGQETKSTCEWLQEHQTAIEELQNNPQGLTCETLSDCQLITDIQDTLSDKANTSDLSAVAFSGSYSDLSGTPTLATVATTGSYSDLSGIPTIPTAVSQLTNDSGFQTAAQVTTAIANKFQFFADLANTSVNTNTSNVVLGSVLIPANTITDGTIIEIETWISRATGGANPGHRLFINTANSYTGANQIAVISIFTVALSSKGERTFICKTGKIRGFGFTTPAAIDDTANANAVTEASVDWTVDQYILTVANNATGETTTHEATTVKVIKP